MKGTFIVLEGPDGAGTTLHSELLADALTKEGRDVLLTAEPTSGSIGSFIRSALKESVTPLSADALQLLFCADRADHLATVILPALEEGKTVVCDRYIPSTLLYGQESGCSRDWLEYLNKNFVREDHLIIALPPVEVLHERIARRSEHDAFEKREFVEKIHKAYATFAKETGAAVIDTSGEKEMTAQHILSLVR